MVLVCSVKSCINAKRKTKEKRSKMHRYPKDLCLCKEWSTQCKRPDLYNKPVKVLNTNYRVCTKHFAAKMYSNPERTLLLPTAIPTEFAEEKCEEVTHEETVQNIEANDNNIKLEPIN